MTRRLPVVLCLAVASATGVQARQALPRADADSMAAKVATITVRGTLPPIPGVDPIVVRTTFTDREANAYLLIYGPEFLPVGVVNPTVKIGKGNLVSATAIVDLDAVRTARPRGWLDPLAYVGGSVEIRMAGRLHAANGVGLVQFESASVGGVPVAESLIQEVISFYTTTPDMPQGYRLGEPGPLPANIQAVELTAGAATVVQ